ncbi:exopolyphosphatase [uncultured Robinsoniella sp.]|uniref:Ppx/GppA phosphatase family protein n=1 Tax=uncultured Robinsoniella sp. TaxID=904190 RepID=UPI00374EBFDD
MTMATYAAIDVGSYEIEMKIFELSSRRGMREIDCIRHRMELGKDAYRTGKISVELVEELCSVLQDFLVIMKGYRVDAFRACATSAVRETKNKLIMLDYIEKRTGIKIEVLGNSEERFLDYKSIASREAEFANIIQKGTAILDVGGGSMQISLFDKDSLVTTQNIRLGNMRIRERLSDMENQTPHMEVLIEELINNEVLGFKKLYLKEREIQNVILIGDYILDLTKKSFLTKEEFLDLYDTVICKSPEDIAEAYEIPYESASLIIPSVIIYKRLLEEMEAEAIWVPGVSLCDGMAYEFAQKNKIIKSLHNFDNDIIAAARNISKRYQCNKGHIKALEDLAIPIFDKLKKVHGMNARDRLLLRIAVILHGCGKYISLSNVAECSYSIVMATEIIGLSHVEREIIANVVKYNTMDFSYYDVTEGRITEISKDEYLKIAKLTAILRVTNALDRSHKQKFKDVRLSFRENELLIIAETQEDITLEKGLFREKADFFEEVFSIRPVIKQKKLM